MASHLALAVILFLLSPQIVAAPMLTPIIPNEGLQAEKNGEWQKAVSIYTDSLLKDEHNSALWLRIAQLEYWSKNYSLAINAYKHAAQIEPSNPEINKRLSELYAQLNQPQESLIELKKAIALDPDNQEYLISLGQIANWNNEAKTALTAYQHLLVLKKNTQSKDDFSNLLIQIARLQTQLGQYDAAIKTYQELVSIKASALAFQGLSQNYAQTNQPVKALEAINKALQLEPENIEFLRSKAMLASWLHNIPLAITTYQQIISLTPKQVPEQIAVNSLQESLQLISIFPHKMTKIEQLSPPISPLDKWINLSNNEAMQHHYKNAADAMKNAISLKPKDEQLYKKLSEIYAMAKQPAASLNAINQALKINPNNINYLRTRAQLAAWANDKIQMQNSYERIIKLKSYDEDALLNMGFVYAWRGLTDEALAAYKYFLSIYPNNAEGWIRYSEPLSWVENYQHSLDALNRYKTLQGSTNRYLRIKARVLAWVGYYNSARALNAPLLKQNPNDPYLLSTEATLEMNGLETKKSLLALEKLKKLHPDYFQIPGLDDILLTPLRSNINLGANYTSASDTTRVMQIPTLVGQYFLTPTTSLLLQGFYERAIASSYSQLDTISGNESIFDENMMVGFTTQIPSVANLKGLIGDLKIQDKNNHFIYNGVINTNLNERTQLIVENSYNLYRPYLIPQSPRLISLQIMENRLGGFMQWQPMPKKYLNLLVSHSDLTDRNAYWHVTVWPKVRVFNSQYWQVTLGANSDTWDYKRRVVNHGYYSPLNFQSYEGTIDLYYAISENMGFSFTGGFGMQKDETYHRFYYR